MNKEHIGSDFDDFLEENGLFAVSVITAIKRVVAYLIIQIISS